MKGDQKQLEHPGACPVCASTTLQGMPFGYTFNGQWLGAHQCGSCGVIFLHPQPSAQEIAQMYSKEYFEGDFRCGHAGSYFDEQTQVSLADKELLDRIRQWKPSGRFLEIGCAGGAFLHAAQQAGYDVRGAEFSDVAAQLAREKFGLDVVTGSVADAHYADNMFDVVFMGDVLEHLPDPVGTCNEIRRVMKPGGIFVIECPMQTNTLFSRLGFAAYSLLGRKAVVQLPPYHLFEYRPASMSALLHRCGFTVLRKSEGMIPPGKIALRGSGPQRWGKKMFQYPNYLLTRTVGILGDRIEMVGEKPPG